MNATNTTEVTRSEAWRRGYETYLNYWVAYDGLNPSVTACPAFGMPFCPESQEIIAGWNQAKREAGHGR